MLSSAGSSTLNGDACVGSLGAWINCDSVIAATYIEEVVSVLNGEIRSQLFLKLFRIRFLAYSI